MVEESRNQSSISTHSLTRRLTKKVAYGGIEDDYFNSQPHKEADPAPSKQYRDQ